MTLLQIENLGISFGGLRAVNDVGFSARPGEIVSVIGPNGAGKTTLFNMISGVYLPNAGRVLLDGQDVTRCESHRLARKGLTRTFQNLQIFQDMTVLENVIVGFHLAERGHLLAGHFVIASHQAALKGRAGKSHGSAPARASGQGRRSCGGKPVLWFAKETGNRAGPCHGATSLAAR